MLTRVCFSSEDSACRFSTLIISFCWQTSWIAISSVHSSVWQNPPNSKRREYTRILYKKCRLTFWSVQQTFAHLRRVIRHFRTQTTEFHFSSQLLLWINRWWTSWKVESAAKIKVNNLNWTWKITFRAEQNDPIVRLHRRYKTEVWENWTNSLRFGNRSRQIVS